MFCSSAAMTSPSQLSSNGVSGAVSLKMRSRLMAVDSTGEGSAEGTQANGWVPGGAGSGVAAQFAQLQLAVQQELEGFQMAARLGHVAAPCVQAVAVDQVTPHRPLVELGFHLRGQHVHV